nr:hypothetical protein [Tanacetum cinerariifolium]
KKIYKPTNNNLRTSLNTSRANQDNSPRIYRNVGYENQRNGNVVRARENVGSSVVQKSGIQCYNCKEFGHVARKHQKKGKGCSLSWGKDAIILGNRSTLYVYGTTTRDNETSNDKEIDKLMALISLSSNTSRANQDNSPRINRGAGYENQRNGNVAGARETVADSGPIFDVEPLQKVSNDDHYNVFANESEHPEQSKFVHDTYLIEQDAHNVIIDSLDMSYNKEEIDQNDDDNDLANEQLARRNSVEYASKVEIDCSKARGDLISYKMESQRSFNKYTQTINDLNHTISKMKEKLCVHQETISILSQQKEAQIKLYKTRKDNELDKVIALENKIKVLDNIVYKTCQSVQMMNMLNNKCRTSFTKPEFLKKDQRANPHLYDIGCYNDNLALMLAPESDEEMVADLRYCNSLALEVNSLRSQPETQKIQFLNEIDRLSREYYYVDQMNAILGVYTKLDEVTNLQCDYLELLEKCECLEKELSKSKMMSKIFEALQKHVVNLELDLQQYKEKLKNDKSFYVNQLKDFCKEREQYFEIQDLKA